MAGTASSIGQWLRKPSGQGVLLLLLLITVFLREPLFTNRPLLAADLLFYLDPLWQPLAPAGFTVPSNQILSDQVFEFYPWQKFVRAELSHGRVPLWNPYVNSGHPLLANGQSAPFDPFNLVALLWPLAKSFVVVAFLRLLVAGTFTLLLALELGLSRFAAYLAMVVFTFALPQIVWLLYPKASALVWLPAILFFTLRLIRTRKGRYGAALALAIGAQVMGGHPETSLYTALVWLAFAVYWLRQAHGTPRQLRDSTIVLGGAGLLGVGIGAVQWLPVAEALLNSEILASRSRTPLNWQGIFFQWQDWAAALTMLLPDFFGNPRDHRYWYPYSNYTEQTLYVGTLPLALALLVFVRRAWARQAGFWLALSVISLGLALRLPLFPLLAEVPGLSVTNSGRLRALYMLAVAMLAGVGLDLVRQSLLAADGNRSATVGWLQRILWAVGLGASLIVAASYVFVTQWQEQLVELARSQVQAGQGNPFLFLPAEEYLALAEVRVQQMAESFLPTNWRMVLPLLWAPAAWGAVHAVWLWVRLPHRRAQFISVIFVTLVVADLWLFGRHFNPTIAPEQVYPTPELVQILQQSVSSGEPFRIAGTGLALVPNVGVVFGLEDVRGYDPIAPRRYMALMNRVEGTVRVGHHLLLTQANAPVLDFLNVRYVFTTGPVDDRWTPVQESSGVTLYANLDAMPRVAMIYNARLAATPDQSLVMTAEPDFDFHNVVVLEGLDELPPQPVPATSPQVEVITYLPGTMTVAVTSEAAGFLVASDPYTPGWVASVDGVAAEILVANHAFRAVRVPAGEHTVTFRYQPASFTLGVWISAISLFTLVVFLLLPQLLRKAAKPFVDSNPH